MAAIDARPVSTWTTSVRVRLTADRSSLVWSPPFTRVVERPADDVTLAQEFIRLSKPDLKASSFRDFAEKYGPLHLCSHGLPRTHIDVREREFFPADLVDDHYIPNSWGGSTLAEPITAWASLARQAHAMASISDDLSDNVGAPSEIWSQLLPLLPQLPPTVQGQAFDPATGELDVQRRALAACVQRWIDWGGVSLTFSWDSNDKRPTARNGATTLFGAVALGLALRLSRGGELRVCPGCREEFTPTRRRDPNKQAWCKDCMYDVRRRNWQREYRARRRLEREQGS